MKKEILETVRGEGGKLYKPGDEEKLAAEFDQKSLDNLAEAGVIAGEWKSFKDAENFLSLEETMRRFEEGDESEIVYQSMRYHQRQRKAAMEAENGADPALKEKTKEVAKTVEKTAKSKTEKKPEALPKDFPGSDKLTELGLETVEEVHRLDKAQLMEIGLDEKTAEAALAYKIK